MRPDEKEIRENQRRFEAIKQQIFKAFAGVKLGDGIGFYEAGAIDDYLNPTDPDYIEEKARDEREDWTKVYAELEALESFAQTRSCFMDARGLHFYLPVVLLLCDSVCRDSVLMHGVVDKHPQNLELIRLLTHEQKQSILDCIADEVDYEASIAYFINFKGPICHCCGKIHYPTRYSKEEAIAEVEGTDEYVLLQFLKVLFKN